MAARRKRVVPIHHFEQTPDPRRVPGERPDAEIFDADGTLWDVSGIRHLIDGPGGFHAFHAASVDCPLNPMVVAAAWRAHAAGRKILLVTAREAIWRHHTAWPLALHGIPTDAMWMRAPRDFRPDAEVKDEIADHIERLYTVRNTHDDNPFVLPVWERRGWPTTLVPGWTGRMPATAAA